MAGDPTTPRIPGLPRPPVLVPVQPRPRRSRKAEVPGELSVTAVLAWRKRQVIRRAREVLAAEPPVELGGHLVRALPSAVLASRIGCERTGMRNDVEGAPGLSIVHHTHRNRTALWVVLDESEA